MRALLLIGCALFSSPLLADCLQSEAIATATADFTWSARTVSATPRAHFYSAPSSECRLDAFLVPGDAVQVFRLSQSDSQNVDDKTRPFAWVSYRDSKGRVATGWMETAALKAQQDTLKPEGVCAARLRELDGVQDPPETANRYEVTGRGRHFFYTAPDAQCRSQQVFLVAGDTVSVGRTLPGFREATWYGKDGQMSEAGWNRRRCTRPARATPGVRISAKAPWPV